MYYKRSSLEIRFYLQRQRQGQVLARWKEGVMGLNAKDCRCCERCTALEKEMRREAEYPITTLQSLGHGNCFQDMHIIPINPLRVSQNVHRRVLG